MKDMKWTKDCAGYKVYKYVLTSFPFFDVEFISSSEFGPWQLGYMFMDWSKNQFERPTFRSIEGAEKYILRKLYKSLSKVDLDKINTIEDLNKIKYVSVSYNTWCNNNGYGKYIHNKLYEKYHWIEGRFLNTTSIAHRYAIRYDRTIDEQDVKNHAVIIVKRHIKRFLNQYKFENSL